MVDTKKSCISLAKQIEKETGHSPRSLLPHIYYVRFDAVYGGYPAFIKALKYRLRVVGVKGLITRRFLLVVSLSILKPSELSVFENTYHINVKDRLVDLNLMIDKLN